MEYLNQALYEKIISIPELTGSDGLLAPNLNWNGQGASSNNNSVVLDLLLTSNFVPPFIVFGYGPASAIGKSRLAQLFIRVYDISKASSTLKIVTISELVRDALNDVEISITRNEEDHKFHLYYRLGQPVRRDEAFDLNFIELEFDCLIP